MVAPDNPDLYSCACLVPAVPSWLGWDGQWGDAQGGVWSTAVPPWLCCHLLLGDLVDQAAFPTTMSLGTLWVPSQPFSSPALGYCRTSLNWCSSCVDVALGGGLGSAGLGSWRAFLTETFWWFYNWIKSLTMCHSGCHKTPVPPLPSLQGHSSSFPWGIQAPHPAGMHSN